MECASCGRTNRATARFCGGCGAVLPATCPACGAASEPGARFCDACGVSLAAAGASARPETARKLVTVVFADLIGSVALHERLDAEAARRATDRYHRAMKAAVEVHGGSVVQLLGDGVLAAFGVPRVAEDDAIRAVRAAVGMQRAFRELAREPGSALAEVGLRVAVNTGEIVVGEGEESVIGDPTNVAARLQQEARDGDVIVGEATQRLVGGLVMLAPLGRFALRGRSEAVAAYRVVSLERPAGAQAAPFVGREAELRRLLAVFEAACAAPGARLAVLLGSPGLGKSRLLAELAARVAERATVLAARCDARGGATFAPLADALRALLGIEEGAGGEALRAAVCAVVPGDEAERARIAAGIAALLAGAPAPPEETFFVVRRLLAALAAVRPVVLAIDDLHWAEPLLLDLVEHLVQWSHDVPLLVIAAARPELRDARSSLATAGPLVADVVTLAGLDAGAATRLAASVVGGAELPAALAGRVLAASEGNPLFVAELVRMLVQEGSLRREGERWVTAVEIAKLEMPPTIQVLLAARIERLRPEDRAVLERAAVVGRHFSRAAIAHLLPREADLDARLEALRRSELIEADTGWFLGEPALRFHHVLIRDAAYRRLLKGTRAELHERFADWVAARAGGSVEHDEAIGWHLEQAHRNLRELGALDAHGRALGERAARHLGAAGRRALARDDLALAAGLLGRAQHALEPDDPARADLALDWCEALLSAGDVGPAAEAIAEFAHLADSERLRAWHTCFSGQLAALTDPQALRATAGAVAAAADALAAERDAAGEAKAHQVHATALARLGEFGASEAALDRALAAARGARDRRRANTVLAGAPVAALWGPSPVARASGRCLDVVRVLRITEGAPAVESVALRCQAVLEALRGRREAARRMIASARRTVEELGLAQQLLETDVFAGLIALLEGDAEAAEPLLRAACQGLRERGLGIDAARAAALLARALLAQGRAGEAEALSRESEALAGDDLKAAIAWRGARAEALAQRGEHAAAVAIARDAVRIAEATDALLDHADARVALAAALRAAGRDAEAAGEAARAAALWQAKGATLLATRASDDAGSPSAAAAGAAETAAPAARRRVQPNAATGHAAALDAAMAARDPDALPACFEETVETVHHPTGRVYGREATIERFRATIAGAEELVFGHEALATLGDSLGLFRARVSARSFREAALAVGTVETELVVLIEAGARDRAARVEVFAADALGAAVARLYERHAEALPGGADRARARTLAACVAAHFARDGGPDIDQLPVADDPVFFDHRTLGLPANRDADPLRGARRRLPEVVDERVLRVDDVLALGPSQLLARVTMTGVDRRSGGAFEREMLQLHGFDGEGRLDRVEFFDADREAQALARLDALREPRAPARRVRPNAATEHLRRLDAAMAARDAAALPDLFTEDARLLQHFNGIEHRREEIVARLERSWRGVGFSFANEPLASLGDGLALARFRAGSEAHPDPELPVGANDVCWNVLLETSGDARARRIEMFAEDQLAAAITRLYELHARRAPEGPERARAAVVARAIAAVLPTDVEEIAAVLDPEVAFLDHRTLGLGAGRGAERYLRGLRTLVDLTREPLASCDDVLHAGPDALALRRTTTGVEQAGGGAFELALILLWTFGGDGRVTRVELFDADRSDEALARLDALIAPRASLRERGQELHGVLRNAATRALERFMAVWWARDWHAIAASFSPSFRLEDRRTLVQTSWNLEEWLSSLRAAPADSRWLIDFERIALRGERLALFRMRFETQDRERGATEIHALAVHEIDERGLRSASVLFDEADLEAARAELDARYHAGEAAPWGAITASMRTFGAAFAGRDWDALAAHCAPAIEVHDHRRLGWEPLRGPAAYVGALRALVALAPDTRLRLDRVTVHERGYLVVTVWEGTREGGPFEEPSWMVAELDGAARVVRFDQYDLEHHELALARFEALRPDPLRIPPNAATRAMDRWIERAAVGDEAALDSLCAPEVVWEDRRRGTLVTGGRDTFVANSRLIAASRARHTRTRLAISGDRLALHRTRFTLGDETAPAEIEMLELTEVDAAGRIVAALVFDPEERHTAALEMLERYMRGEGARSMPPDQVAFLRAMMARDLAAMRAALPDDFAFVDHRRTGLGRIGNADDYVASVAAVLEQAQDLATDVLYHVAVAEHGSLSVGRMFGTLRGGGDFESVFVRLNRYDGGRNVGAELFELEDLERAKARFAELRAASAARAAELLRIPPNAATRAIQRVGELAAARDWSGLADLLAPDFRFEDRRRGLRDAGDRAGMLASMRLAATSGARAAAETLSIAGDRFALQRLRFSPADGQQGETLQIVELDGAGRIAALVSLDVEDRCAAVAEMLGRYADSDAGKHVPGALVEMNAALAARDAAGVRASWPAGYVLEDHRRTGLGRIADPDAYLASVAALWEQSPDLYTDRLYSLAEGARGSLGVCVTAGTLASGGAFESYFLRVQTWREGRWIRTDLFELEDLERARACFAAQCGEPA